MSSNPIEPEQIIEADSLDGGSDYDSAFTDTSTASLSSSINEYVFENGRRYHTYYGPDRNPLPTDETEQDRMDLQHEMTLSLLGGVLYLAPIAGTNPQKILDLGTGTGIWAIDMADQFPSAEVIGTDLSPIQPTWVPPNCRFEVDDAELKWMYGEDVFDYIHARNIGQAISNWPKLMAEIFHATKPGGHAEFSEIGGIPKTDDNTMAKDHSTNVWFGKMAEAMVKIGRPASMTAEQLSTYLKNAGFVDVFVKKYKVPLAPWPKDKDLKRVGAMNLLSSETGYCAYGMSVFTKVLGMSTEEAEDICNRALAGARKLDSHSYQIFHVAYGRKPE